MKNSVGEQKSMKKETKMELGNFIFGNSRGEYPIERGVGFEEELIKLFGAYASDRDNSWREYGIEFENDVFSVFPYYWGDCTCGFDDTEDLVKHINCYQNEVREEKLKNGWFEDKYGWLERERSYEENKKIEDGIYKKLCKKYNLPFPGGCAVHCTCDYDKRYEEWLKQIGYPDGHKEDCLLVKPNFHYKPTDLRIKWYKYPLRDSYSDKPITLEEFREVIDNCIKSIKEVI